MERFKKKYEGGKNTESLLVDLTIETITWIELKNKFETTYDEYVDITEGIKDLCDELKLDVSVWNIFKTKYLYKIEKLLYRELRAPEITSIVNIYENTEDDSDFFIFFIDEWSDLTKREYIEDRKCFDIIDCDVFNEIEVINCYTQILPEAQEDKYALTVAKNQCLYILNHQAPRTQATGLIVKTPEAVEKEVKPKSQPNLNDYHSHVVESLKNEAREKSLEKSQGFKSFEPDPQVVAIKETLIANLELIKDGKMTSEQANSINNTVQTFINLSKVELEYRKLLKN